MYPTISGMKTLEKLNLEATRVTGAGLEALPRGRLLELNLRKTRVRSLRGLSGFSSAGLEHLKGLKKLKDLYLTDLKISKEAVEKLKKAIPGLSVAGP